MDQTITKNIGRYLSEYGIGVALVLEIAFFSYLSPSFFTLDNLLNVPLQNSIIAIIAVGMTFVILTAGIDLSVGALVAMSGVITTSVLKIDLPFVPAFALALLAGLALGFVS